MKRNKIRIGLLVLLLVIGSVFPATSALADENENNDEEGPWQEFEQVFGRAVDFLVFIAGGITTILLIFCVFMWQKEKAENPDSQDAADWKSRAVKVLVGLVVILAARTIIGIVEYIASPAAEQVILTLSTLL